MKWLDNLIVEWSNRIQLNQFNYKEDIEEEDIRPMRIGWGRKGNNTLGSDRSNGPSVQANYDDRSVISFKVYGANGGMIVETMRYDDKRDSECISRYVIDDEADVSESLSKIITMEYMK